MSEKILAKVDGRNGSNSPRPVSNEYDYRVILCVEGIDDKTFYLPCKRYLEKCTGHKNIKIEDKGTCTCVLNYSSGDQEYCLKFIDADFHIIDKTENYLNPHYKTFITHGYSFENYADSEQFIIDIIDTENINKNPREVFDILQKMIERLIPITILQYLQWKTVKENYIISNKKNKEKSYGRFSNCIEKMKKTPTQDVYEVLKEEKISDFFSMPFCDLQNKIQAYQNNNTLNWKRYTRGKTIQNILHHIIDINACSQGQFSGNIALHIDIPPVLQVFIDKHVKPIKSFQQSKGQSSVSRMEV